VKVVHVPGSKSIANRALVAAALADGASVLTNVPDGDDTVAMLDCLRGLGVAVDAAATEVAVAGTGGVLRPRADRLDARLAGTTSRFATALAALAGEPVTVDGDPPLRARPMVGLHDALASLGASVERGEGVTGLPVTVEGPLRGGRVAMRGDVSSQFVTALMLIGPVLDGGLDIELTTPLVSTPYVRMTEAVMRSFGVDGVEIAAGRIVVPQAPYRGTKYQIEPDASSASYPLAIAAVRGGTVTVAGLTRASVQGDVAFLDLLQAMGCDVGSDDVGTKVSRGPGSALRGVDVDMADISDLVPTVAALAVTASTPTTIRGVGFIRSKESDRLGDLARELRKTGARIDDAADGLHIEPVIGGPAGLHGATLATHHDHRLAMAFAVLGAAVNGIVVDDPAVVSKSWPGFWDVYGTLVAKR
jgi:3-phosphoshikimate 1-carboxyvinyltransferase